MANGCIAIATPRCPCPPLAPLQPLRTEAMPSRYFLKSGLKKFRARWIVEGKECNKKGFLTYDEALKHEKAQFHLTWTFKQRHAKAKKQVATKYSRAKALKHNECTRTGERQAIKYANDVLGIKVHALGCGSTLADAIIEIPDLPLGLNPELVKYWVAQFKSRDRGRYFKTRTKKQKGYETR